ncbi:unnamed protein product, partial [Owenia fusiformis]
MQKKAVTICLIISAVLVSYLDLAFGQLEEFVEYHTEIYLNSSEDDDDKQGDVINTRTLSEIDVKLTKIVRVGGCPMRSDKEFHTSKLYEDMASEDCTTFINCKGGRSVVQDCNCLHYDTDGTCEVRMMFKQKLHSCVNPNKVNCKRKKSKKEKKRKRKR